MDYEQLMKKAREHNRAFDKIDGRPFVRMPVPEQIATVMEAIKAGIKAVDWDCVAQAQGLLEDLWTVIPGRQRENPLVSDEELKAIDPVILRAFIEAKRKLRDAGE